MFNAYKIGITVALTNSIGGALNAMAAQLGATNAKAIALKASMKEIGIVSGLGIAAGAVAYANIRMLHGIIEPANEYIHQLGIMRRAGLDNVDMAQSVAAAWKNTSTVITTTATDNLKSLLDLRNIIADTNKEGGDVQGRRIDMSIALKELPLISKIQAVLMASKEGKIAANADQLAFSLAKALDIRGAATDPARFEREASDMARVITAMQGRVTPQMYQSVYQYARQAKFDLSEEFVSQILPTLMLESATATGGGGGSRGVGPMLSALYRITNQGIVNRQQIPEFERLGLLAPGTGQHAKGGKYYDPTSGKLLTTNTTQAVIGPILGHELAAQNPLKWVQEYLLPALKKTYGANLTDEQIRYHINQVAKGNQLAASLLVELATKQANFLRDQSIIKGAMNVNDAYRDAIATDPILANKALAAQWTNLKTALGFSLAPELVGVMMKITTGLNNAARWLKDNQWAAKAITDTMLALTGIGGLGAAALVLRGTFLSLKMIATLGGLAPFLASAVGLGSVPFLPIAAGITAVGVALFGVYDLWKNWDTAKPKLKAFADASAAQTAGVYGDLFGSHPWVNRSIFDMLGFGNKTGGGVFDTQNKSAALLNKLDAMADAFKGASVHIDGEKVGNIVFGHATKGQNWPASSISGHDSALSLPRF